MRYINPYFIGIPNVILLLIGIFQKPLFSLFVLKIIGALFILLLFILEFESHKVHKQAHQNAEKIKKVIKNGLYSKVRHPIYLGWFLFNIGFFLIFSSLFCLVIAIIFIILWYLEAKSEEKILIERFGKEYIKYKKEVPGFLPRLIKA